MTASAFLDAPHSTHTEQHIVNALRRAGKLSISLVAEADDAVIGHVAISPVSVSDRASGWFGLGPISVLPQHQRRGIGSLLTREALRIVFAGQKVGIREVADQIWLVSFMHYDLGFFDHETGRVECADNPFKARVLPMSSE